MTWVVVYQRAFDIWVAESQPSDARIDLVSEWLTLAEIAGPPSNSATVSNDFYLALIEGAAVRAYFIAVAQDRWMRIDEFR